MSSRPDVGAPDTFRDELLAVHKFTGFMITKLVENRHKGGWESTPPSGLFNRAQNEMDEVRSALYAYMSNASRPEGSEADQKRQRREDARKLALECADAANFLMMLADVVTKADEGG